jgi:3-isopropylmalate/(R)-2-methylmalate dehydratase large subunit
MEFTGDAINDLPVADRMTMANMAIEAGAKNGIIAPDESTLDYVRPRAKRPFECYTSDPDAQYAESKTYDISGIEPQVAFPYLPDNTRGISEVGTVPIQQAVIGSCTNGRIEDLRLAASVLNGHTVNDNIRLIIIPATPTIYRQAMEEGLLEVFLGQGDCESTYLRPLPGRFYGYPGTGGAGRGNHQPQLCGPHGALL